MCIRDRVRFGPVAFWIAVGTVVIMAGWSVAAATYLAFRDDVLRTLIAHQAEQQFAYEDRIAELRAQIDRTTSRQLLDQEQVEQKLDDLMRRQATPVSYTHLYDFSFLAPCPSSGLIIHGDKDAVVPHRDVTNLVEKLKTQKGIIIEQKIVPGANHFFDGKVEPLMTSISQYLDKRLGKSGRATTAA